MRGVNGTIGTPVDLTVDMGPTVTASSGVSQEQLQNLTDFLERIFIQHAVIDSDNVALSLRAKYLVRTSNVASAEGRQSANE